jgi:twitching motility protein PilT
MQTKTDEFLNSLITEGVSDIHFKAMRPPLVRINGILRPAKDKQQLTPKDTENLAMNLLGAESWIKFKEILEFDSSYAIPGVCRFRISVFKQRGSISLVMRIIPFNVPTLDSLDTPPVLKEIAMYERGLVLVSGVTGSGKSSTLAGMINHVNQNRECHVITIEDPIEFLHKDKKASINQRELSIDTRSFATAFRAALRQDPDIILVGELRDHETMEIALQAAETGHLVMSTVHTADAKEAIGRFIDTFPPFQQKHVRLQLAANLRAVVSQRLLERADHKGRALASEVMIVNAAVRGHIIDPEKTHEIIQNMEKGREQYGSQTFDQALFDLLKAEIITEETAIQNATSPHDLKVKLRLE